MFFGDDDDEENNLVERGRNSERFICASISKVIYPQGGKNKKNQWRLIVNQGEDGYMQGIRVEECARYAKSLSKLNFGIFGFRTIIFILE